MFKAVDLLRKNDIFDIPSLTPLHANFKEYFQEKHI